jgi:hypothetical protein
MTEIVVAPDHSSNTPRVLTRFYVSSWALIALKVISFLLRLKIIHYLIICRKQFKLTLEHTPNFVKILVS